MRHGTTIRPHATFPQAIGAVRAALAGRGFGVLTQIELPATMRDTAGHQKAPRRLPTAAPAALTIAATSRRAPRNATPRDTG